MRLIKSGLAAGASLAMMLSSTGVVLGSTAMISETGAKSVNYAHVNHECISVVSQSNTSDINNSVNIVQSTGNNQASKNTGDASISTGPASAGVLIANAGSSNTLIDDNSCCCEDSDMEVMIEKTGYRSRNKTSVSKTSLMQRLQDNRSRRMNFVNIHQRTGDNEADKNTGGADVVTDETFVTVEVLNDSDMNTLGV